MEVSESTIVNFGADKQLDRKIGIAEQAQFREIAKDSAQFPLTRELLENSDFRPVAKIDIGDKDFFMSEVFDTGGRLQTLMYVPDRNYQILPRVFYKSNSDGGWRACPGFDSRHGVYMKGSGIHYTQETKPHEEIIKYLDDASNSIPHPIREDLIKNYFTVERPQLPEWYTFDIESRKFNDNGALSEFQKYPPGYYDAREIGTQGLTDVFEQFDFQKKGLENFVPDFKAEPASVETIQHTLLGSITAETFKGATLAGRPIQWTMAYDKEGRTWIDRITFDDNRVNTYGVHPEVIDSGALTNKPIEYAQQASGLVPDKETKPFSRQYVDITPLLSHLAPIKAFRQARFEK